MAAESTFKPREVWRGEVAETGEGTERAWRVVETSPGAFVLEVQAGADSMGTPIWHKTSGVRAEFAGAMVAAALADAKRIARSEGAMARPVVGRRYQMRTPCGVPLDSVPGFVAIMGPEAIAFFNPKDYAQNVLTGVVKAMAPFSAEEVGAPWQRVAEWHVDVKQAIACLGMLEVAKCEGEE